MLFFVSTHNFGSITKILSGTKLFHCLLFHFFGFFFNKYHFWPFPMDIYLGIHKMNVSCYGYEEWYTCEKYYLKSFIDPSDIIENR